MASGVGPIDIRVWLEQGCNADTIKSDIVRSLYVTQIDECGQYVDVRSNRLDVATACEFSVRPINEKRHTVAAIVFASLARSHAGVESAPARRRTQC